MIPLLSLDFETTGLDVCHDRIVEVGAVSLSPPGYLVLLDSLVDPGTVIPLSASRVHRVTDAKATMAPPTRDVLTQLLDWLDTVDGVVGYNIDDYDWRLLREECRRAGLGDRFEAIHKRVVIFDVMRLLPRRQSLVAVASSMFGNDGGFNAHSAVADATMTARVFMRMVETGMIRL